MRIDLSLMVGVSLVVFSAGALCVPPARAAEPTAKEVRATAADTPVTDEQRNAEVRAKLAKRMNIEFLETPLNQVLEFLSDAAAVQMHLKTRALDDVGIDQDTPMTLNLKDVSVETGLDLLLDDLQLDFAIDRGLVIISTPKDLQAKSVVRVYPLHALLADLPPEQMEREAGHLAGIIAAQVAPDTWGKVEVGPYRASGGIAAPGMMGTGAPMLPGAAAPSMMGMGASGSQVAPRVSVPGEMPGNIPLGGSGAISVFNRLLIVRNSIKVQDQVDQFLRLLTDAKSDKQ
jgi:hypothetical protein